MPSKTILVTGCSDGGLGAALARAFHQAGWRVIATARNLSKMTSLQSVTGIEVPRLHVLSEESVRQCVVEVERQTGGSLDGFVNNAGAVYAMPLSDSSIAEAKKLFDLNFWAVVTATQAFLPLLMESKPGAIIVHNTSASSVVGMPFQGVYNMSKAAAAMFSETLRLELLPFNIKVFDLKTGMVSSNITTNAKGNGLQAHLPEIYGTMYRAAREHVERIMSGEQVKGKGESPERWAGHVVGDLSKRNPPIEVWGGRLCWTCTTQCLVTPGPVAFRGQETERTGCD